MLIFVPPNGSGSARAHARGPFTSEFEADWIEFEDERLAPSADEDSRLVILARQKWQQHR
jgi:hypothetical protein